jgi:predicted nuclease of predicted toxin-antitoxin system
MSRLFIELYLDEDVDVLIAQLMRARGFVVVTTQEAGHLGITDAEQWAYAISQHKTLLTHNRVDFETLAQTYFVAGQPHDGIIIAVRRLPREIARRLLRILNAVTAEEMQNQVRYI